MVPSKERMWLDLHIGKTILIAVGRPGSRG